MMKLHTAYLTTEDVDMKVDRETIIVHKSTAYLPTDCPAPVELMFHHLLQTPEDPLEPSYALPYADPPLQDFTLCYALPSYNSRDRTSTFMFKLDLKFAKP